MLWMRQPYLLQKKNSIPVVLFNIQPPGQLTKVVHGARESLRKFHKGKTYVYIC